MALYTREDGCRFRRTTWLLCKLQVIGPRGDTTSDDPPSPSADVVIPTASPHQQNLYVAAEVDNEPLSEAEVDNEPLSEEELLANEEELLANVIGGPYYVTRNLRRQV
jgi:hypothetical protein